MDENRGNERCRGKKMIKEEERECFLERKGVRDYTQLDI